MINAPPPVAEYAVANGHYRWDLAWPEVKVAIEVSGWDGHAAHSDWLRNIEKRNWGVAHGWLILEFAWDHVTNNPAAVAAEIQRVLAERTLAFRLLPPQL
jgi:very-short-patch-repair endonuclease